MQLQIIRKVRWLHSDIVKYNSSSYIIAIYHQRIETFTTWLCEQGHGCERVVQKAATGAAIPGAILYHDFFLNRDHRQSCDAFANSTPQRISHALQHRGTRRLYRLDQGKCENPQIIRKSRLWNDNDVIKLSIYSVPIAISNDSSSRNHCFYKHIREKESIRKKT